MQSRSGRDVLVFVAAYRCAAARRNRLFMCSLFARRARPAERRCLRAALGFYFGAVFFVEVGDDVVVIVEDHIAVNQYRDARLARDGFHFVALGM